MLQRLVILILVVGAVYFVVTEVMPHLVGKSGGTRTEGSASGIDGADGQCIDAAERANDRLISAARDFGQPPVDREAWSSAKWEIESQLQSASAACLCGSEACRAASEAVGEMGELLANLDAMVRGDSPGFANPANQQERIYRHLEAARSAAGY